MGYIPNTPDDMREMLASLGLKNIDELIAKAIPKDLLRKTPLDLPEPLSEYEALAEASSLAEDCADSNTMVCFMGAGAYDHYIPAIVHHITSRPEFYTAYTPYQAEVSQGTLHAIFEFQSLIANLTAMDVANASMYDGASALAEAALLALSHTNRKKIIVGAHLHPNYLAVLKTYLHPSGAEIILAPAKGGITDIEAPSKMVDANTAAVIVQNPNFVGCIEDGFAFKKTVEGKGALLIACVDPISLGMLTPPGKYGADIAVGEGQSMGIPLGFGGPYLGFFAAREEFVRRMPGRLIGASSDDNGTRGFVMTLQTREQHIRRDKATSNICTNEALCALAASVYLAIVGEQGLNHIANLCYQKAHYLAEKIEKEGFGKVVHKDPFFNEFLVEIKGDAESFVEKMALEGFLAGVPMSKLYPENKNQLLIAVTEKRSIEEMDDFVETAIDIINL